MRLFRPFPAALIQEAVGDIPLIAVLDRSCSYGYGGIWAQEIRSAFYPMDGWQGKKIYGFITGLGGREVLPETLIKIYRYVLKQPKPTLKPVWVDVWIAPM